MNFLLILGLILAPVGLSKSAKTYLMDEKTMALVRVGTGRSTVLSFPSKPQKVVLGNKGLFGVEYIENDLAITSLKGSSRSNLFVYLEKERFGFDLVGESGSGDEIIFVKRKVGPHEAKH